MIYCHIGIVGSFTIFGNNDLQIAILDTSKSVRFPLCLPKV
jgi:hypothetical protein